MTTLIEAMTAQIDAQATRDEAIIHMVTQHGQSLNAATKLYATTAKDMGISTGLASRKDEALALLSLSEDMDGDEIKSISTAIADELDITANTVRGYIKTYFEDKGWEWPSAIESDPILEWLVANSECSKEEFKGFMATAGKDGGPRSASNVNEYWKGMRLHRMIVAS